MTVAGGRNLWAQREVPSTPQPWQDGTELELWSYRDRTVAILKRYARASVEVGRLPSLLGREFFRTRVTSYSLHTFEDVVIFVHDVERALERLRPFQQRLVAMSVLEEYSQPEVARLLPCPLRTVERELPEALDTLSRMFLDGGLIKEFACVKTARKTCQEGKDHRCGVNDCKRGNNIC
jgi:DNA-directed RNA polymerase specialized sigma24 family protein